MRLIEEAKTVGPNCKSTVKFIFWMIMIALVGIMFLSLTTGCADLLRGYGDGQDPETIAKYEALDKKFEDLIKKYDEDKTVDVGGALEAYKETQELLKIVKDKKQGVPFAEFIGWMIAIATGASAGTYPIVRKIRKAIFPEEKTRRT